MFPVPTCLENMIGRLGRLCITKMLHFYLLTEPTGSFNVTDLVGRISPHSLPVVRLAISLAKK